VFAHVDFKLKMLIWPADVWCASNAPSLLRGHDIAVWLSCGD
jgi:hypothetical protein